MKTSVLFSVLLFCFPVFATGKELMIELKAPTACLDVKKYFSKESLVFRCDPASTAKVKYFSATYLGKKAMEEYASSLRKDRKVSSVSEDKEIKRLE